MVCWTIDRLEPKTCAILIPWRAAGGGAPLRRRLFWSSANAVTIHPAAGGGQVPRQPARLKSAPPEGSAAPGRFFMRPAVGARGSFALSGVIEFAGFTSLSYPVWFNSRRPHHIPYPVTGTTRAHDGFLHAFSPSPGACGRPLRACTRRRPRKALRLCAFIFCNRYMRWRGRNEQST